jgi:hypothetical protein
MMTCFLQQRMPPDYDRNCLAVSCQLVGCLQAMTKFNLQRVLSDPTGEQDRPLVVRRANMRKPAASLMLGGQSGLQAAAAGLSANSAFSSSSNVGAGHHLSLSSGPLSAMELQQQGSLSQMGLGAPEMPLYLQPLMAMQVCTGMQAQEQAAPADYGVPAMFAQAR